jgi:hypothetical protein
VVPLRRLGAADLEHKLPAAEGCWAALLALAPLALFASFPTMLLWLAALALLCFVLAPIVMILAKSVQNRDGTLAGIAHFRAYLTTPALWRSVWNSVWVSTLATAITVPLALTFAYALTRSRIGAKGLLRSTVGQALGLRHSPSLHFEQDVIEDNVRHIDELLAANETNLAQDAVNGRLIAIEDECRDVEQPPCPLRIRPAIL